MSRLVLLRHGYKEILLNPRHIEAVQKVEDSIRIVTAGGRTYFVQEIYRGGKYEELSNYNSLNNLIDILSCRGQVEEGGDGNVESI